MPVRHTLLGLLSQQPRHGYELVQAFQSVAGGRDVWEIKPAQVYMTLSRLMEVGSIQEETDPVNQGDKRVYAITPQGEQELAQWLATPVPSTHQRDEFFLKLMLAIALESISPRQVIYTQRASLYQELHDLTTRRMALDPNVDLARILLLDQAVMHVEADLRWLDMIEARLDEVQRQPLPEPERRPRGRPVRAIRG